MTNQEYFIDDCESCKYLVGADGCFALYSDADTCAYCKNKDTHGMCYCLKKADTTLKRCPYWRDLDEV